MTRAAFALVLGLVTTGGLACDGRAGSDGVPGVGNPGTDGDKGDTGPPIDGEASISGVVPGEVFIGRTVDVLISGYGTTWNDDTLVDFGADIEVISVSASTPTALDVTIRVANEAEVGPRDVLVHHGDTELTYGGNVFDVTSPVSLVTLGDGIFEQGSGGIADLFQHDFATPFDGGYHAYIARDGEQLGIDVTVFDISPLSASVVFYIDVDAPPGKADLILEHHFWGTSVVRDAIEIAARTPVPLSDPGTTVDIVGMEQSHLFSLTTTTPSEIDIRLTADDPQPLSTISILPTTKWEDAFFSGGFGGLLPYSFQDGITFFAPQPTTYYAMVNDVDREQVPHMLQIDVTTIPVTLLSPTVPGVQGGDITGGADIDYYVIDAQAGQTLIAATFDATTTSQCAVDLDSFLVLFNETGTQVLNINDDNGVNLCSEMFTFIPEDGTYYLRVAGSPFCGGCAFDYLLYLELQ